jgi:nicotinamide mononucleotide transporter
MSLLKYVPTKEQSLGTHIMQGTVLAILLTGLSFAVGFAMGWVAVDLTWLLSLEAFAVFTSYLCTFLCVVERRVNYPIGAISNGAYSFLFFQFGLIASSIVTGLLTFYLLYGWFRWGADAAPRPVTHLDPKWIPAYLIGTLAAYGLILWVVTMAGGTLAITDSVILIGTLIAQLLLDNKKMETWGAWTVVNVFAIYTYATAGLPLAAFQYVFFLLNAFYGWYMWNRSKVAKDEPATQVQAPLVEVPA